MNIYTGKALSLEESLKQSINLILLTPKGERILNREFGSNVIYYQDMPINKAIIELTPEIASSLKNNDARIVLDEVEIKKNSDSSLTLEIYYNNGEKVDVLT